MPEQDRPRQTNRIQSLGQKLRELVFPAYSVTDISARRQAIFSAMMSLTLFVIILIGLLANILVRGLNHITSMVMAGYCVFLLLAYLFSRFNPNRILGPALLTLGLSLSAFLVALNYPKHEVQYISGAVYTFIPLALVLGGALLPWWGGLILLAGNFAAVMLLPLGISYYPFVQASTDAGAILSIGALLLGVNAYRNGTERMRLAEIQGINQQLEKINSESKRSAQALHESELRFRNFIEQSTEGFTLVDENGVVLEWNQAQSLITGLSREAVLGMTLWDVQLQMTVPERRTEENRERYKMFTLDMLHSGIIPPHLQHMDAEVYKPDGQRVLVKQSIFPIKTERGYQLGTVARDVTKERQAEQEREILQHLALELTAPMTLKELVKVLALHCRQLFTHDAFRFDLYDEVEQLRTPVYAEDTPSEGQTPVDVETEGDARKPEIIRGVFNGKQVLVNRKSGTVSDGLTAWGFSSRRSQSMMFIPVRWHGRCIGVVYVQSYTPERYTDQDLFLLQMVADQCSAALARVQGDAERENLIKELTAKNAELERFTYTVSHDLKSPLITIRGFLGYIEQDTKAGDVNRLKVDIQRVSAATDKMQRLLNDLLEISRIGRVTNEPKTIPFEELAREAVELVRGRISERGIEVQLGANLPTVFGDRQRLVEVLQNLLDNAAKFMGDQPNPCIQVGQSGEEDSKPIFFVKDNGTGIAPKYHEQIFGLFNKLDPKSEGTGIGLALVKRIVEFHGGRIWIESEGMGKGTTFFFTLPERKGD
jgi:PAS domain S-box-containing protein